MIGSDMCQSVETLAFHPERPARPSAPLPIFMDRYTLLLPMAAEELVEHSVIQVDTNTYTYT